MKKIILVAIALVGAFASFHVARGFLEAAAHGGSDAACERRLAAICKAMNAELPSQGSGGLRFDSVVAGPGRRATYNYTFVNLSSAELDPTNLIAQMKPQLVHGYKTDPQLAELRKMEVELRFQYCDKDGNLAATVVVSPNDL